jgi:hypothetical protein
MNIPTRYVPKELSRRDAKKQRDMILQSRRQYKKQKFQTRKRLASFQNRRSHHVQKALRMYGVDTIAPSLKLARATGCSVKALRDIVRKGEGAYYSQGSRPNQTPQSWGLARLASALTAGKAAQVDRHILEQGCHPPLGNSAHTEIVR